MELDGTIWDGVFVLSGWIHLFHSVPLLNVDTYTSGRTSVNKIGKYKKNENVFDISHIKS